MKYLLIFIFCIITFFTNTLHVSAYSPVSTHAGLTEQIVEFYNLSSSKKIGNADMELMVQASITEDFLTRPLNHFYDPIRKIGINGARSSKVWALDGSVVENDFSWPKIMQAYAEGRDAEAVIGLGHILHLIEDLSVPDHTRNDPHKGEGIENGFTGESPYEKWTDGTKNRSTLTSLAKSYASGGNKMYHFSDLGEAFDFLANYSNRNFFSRDTIENTIYQYSLPSLSEMDNQYVYSFDSLSGLKYKVLMVNENLVSGKKDFSLMFEEDSSVLSSYFDRLAKQAVLTGAGVIELFYKEGEKARAEYKIAQLKTQQEEIAKNDALAKSLASKGYLGLAVAGAGILWNQYVTQPIVNTTSKVTGTIALGATGATQATQHYSAFLFSSGSIATQQAKALAASEINKAKDTIVSATAQLGTIIRQTISQAVDGNAQVASASAAINTLNRSAQPTNTSEIIKTKVPDPVQDSVVSIIERISVETIATPSFSSGGGGRVLPVAVVLVEAVLPDAATTTIYVAPTILLTVSECEDSLASDICAIATTTVHVLWQASTTPEYFQLTLSGTQNEIATTTENQAEVTLVDDGEYTFLIEAYENASSSIAYASSTQSVLVIQNPVVINEIAWSGTTATSSDQWIELYNNSEHTIDLSRLNLASTDPSFAVNFSGTVAPHGYFLLERGSDQTVQDISADMIYEATTTTLLPDTGTQLSLLWNNTIIDQTPEITCEDFEERGIFCSGWSGGQSGYQVLSMERFSPTSSGVDMYSWSSNLRYLSVGNDSAGNPIFGTPRAKNSTSYLINGGYDIEIPVTLAAENGPYIIDNGGFVVHSSGSLTIEPGVVIKVYGDSSIYAYGPMYINGTVENPVIFTKLTDTEIASEIPVRVDQLSNTSRFDSMVLYAGSDGSTISNLELHFIKDGIIFDDTFATVDGLGMSDVDYGINIYGGEISISNAEIENVRRDAVAVYEGDMILANSTISGVGDGDAIALYTASSTLDMVSITDVSDGSALGMYDSYVTVANSLFEGGTGAGIELYSSSINLATSTVKDFEDAGVSIFTSDFYLSGNTISNNGIGIEVYDGNGVIALGSLFGNTEYALYNSDLDTLEATGNWWGDATGPYHETDNFSGLGDVIFGPVDFSGWLSAPI